MTLEAVVREEDPPRRHGEVKQRGEDAVVCGCLDTELQSGGIHAWFQPKWQVSDGKIVGAEALARWDHVKYGVQPAGFFLAAIRRQRLERHLLFRMLEDAMKAHLAWRRLGHCVRVSINFPATLLDSADLSAELYEKVQTGGVAPGNISFELLEDETTSLPQNYSLGASRLRQMGFGLALDDFGRGYGSLYNLISAPFSEIKIDRAFVSGAAHDELRHAALTSSIQLGKRLGLMVTAEGVETANDLETLRQTGCDCAQGFFLSPAVRAAEFGSLLTGAAGQTCRLSR